MKRLYKVFLQLICSAAMLALTSCGNALLNRENYKTTQKQTETVTISLNETSVRTLLPTALKLSDFTYIVLKQKETEAEGGEYEIIKHWSGYEALQNDSSLEVAFGTWDFVLSASYNGATYSGSVNNVEVKKGSNITLNFALKLTSQTYAGEGSLDITLNFPYSDNEADFGKNPTKAIVTIESERQYGTSIGPIDVEIPGSSEEDSEGEFRADI